MAGVELATAYYSLVPSMNGTAAAVKSQSNGLTGVWSGIGDDAGRGIKGGILGSIGKMALPIAGAFAAVGIANIIGDSIRAGFDFAKDGVDLAGDVSETFSAIGEIFGQDSLKSFETWSSRGAAELGVTQLAALQAAQSFGVYGKAAGLAGGDLFNFSTDLAGLGTDLSSFFNTSPEEAIEAIGAGLRGESEPLRRFGVLLDDATLRARALTMGIYDGNGSLTQQQRVLAAQAEIFAQTSDAQGDFERTSGGLANQQKILAASFEDAKAKLGTALLPAMTQFMTIANAQFVPILNEIVDKVGPVLADALTEAGPAFGELLTAIAPLIPELVRVGAEILPALITGFVAISPALVDIAANVASAFNTMNVFFSFLRGDTSLAQVTAAVFAASGSMSELAKGVATAVSTVSTFFRQMATNVGAAIGTAVRFVASLPGRIRGVFSGVGGWLVSSGRDLIGGFVDGILSMVGAVGDAVGSVMDFAAGFFPNSPADRGPFSGSGWTAVQSGGAALMEQFAGGFNSRALTPAIAAGAFGAAAAGLARPSAVSLPVGAGSSSGAPGSIIVRIGDEQWTAVMAKGIKSNGAVVYNTVLREGNARS